MGRSNESMDASDREAFRRHLEALNLYGQDLKYKDVKALIEALNRSGETRLADALIRLDHFTAVTEYLRRHVG